MRLTNNTRATIDLVTGIRDGVAVTDDIGPGATKDVDVSEDSIVLKSHLSAQSLTRVDTPAEPGPEPVSKPIGRAVPPARPPAEDPEPLKLSPGL